MTVLLSEPFDNVPMSGWTNSDSSDIATQISGAVGSYGVRLTNESQNHGGYYKSFSGGIAMSVDFYFTANTFFHFSSSGSTYKMMQLSQSYSEIIGVQCSNMGLLEVSCGGRTLISNSAMSSSSWNHIRLEFNLSAQNGFVRLYINGNLDGALSADVSLSQSGPNSIKIASCPYTDADYDELIISTLDIPPEEEPPEFSIPFIETFEGSLMPEEWSSEDVNDSAASIDGYAGNYTGNGCRLTIASFSSYGGYTCSFPQTQNMIIDFYFRTNQFMYFSSGTMLGLYNDSHALLRIAPGMMGTLDIYDSYGGGAISVGSIILNTNTWYNLRLEVNLVDDGLAVLKVNGAVSNSIVGGFGNGAFVNSGATKIKLGTCPYTDADYDELNVSTASSGNSFLVSTLKRNPNGFKRLGL